jgi:hypothetical protein
MVTFGFPLMALLQLAICIYGLLRTRFRATFWLWSVAAFISLGVTAFTAIQRQILPAVSSFTELPFLWSFAAVANYSTYALNFIGLLLLIRSSTIKSHDTVA